MPQATEELREIWHQEGDGKALAHLAPNFTHRWGVIQPRHGYVPTEQDYSAIDYLCQEWDYAYSVHPAEAK